MHTDEHRTGLRWRVTWGDLAGGLASRGAFAIRCIRGDRAAGAGDARPSLGTCGAILAIWCEQMGRLLAA